MSDLIESRISEIRERLTKRTPGEWRIDVTYTDDEYRTPSWLLVSGDATPQNYLSRMLGDIDYPDDAHFIAHAPSDLEALLAEREGMKAEIARLLDRLSESMALQAKATNLATRAMDEKREAESKLAAVRRHPDCVAIMCGATECSSAGAYPCYVNVPASAPLDPSSAPRFHAGHAIALHMVIEMARQFELTGDEKADRNIRNSILRAREVQQWLEPLAHGSHPVPSEGGGE